MRLSGTLAVLLRVRSWRGVVALTYHRTGDPAGSPLHRGLFSATQELLDQQLSTVSRHFDAVTASEVRDAAAAGAGRRVMVTFDDGYRDLYELAYPVLQAHGVRATMFLCSGFIDGIAGAWWDEIAWMLRHAQVSQLPAGPWAQAPLELGAGGLERAIDTVTTAYWEQPPADAARFLEALAGATAAGRRPAGAAREDWITWEMARTMRASGHELGAHTVRHPVLSRLPAEAQAEEIEGSLARIESQTGARPSAFAYPVGGPEAFSTQTARLAAEAGVRLAFSNYGGYVTPASFQPLDLPRFSAEMLRDPAVFAATLALPRVFAKARHLATPPPAPARRPAAGPDSVPSSSTARI